MSEGPAVICDACGGVAEGAADFVGPQVKKGSPTGFRAVEWLGRSLTLADLRPCGFNLLHRPDSWFDTFVQWQEGPPRNLAEWQAAIAESEGREM